VEMYSSLRSRASFSARSSTSFSSRDRCGCAPDCLGRRAAAASFSLRSRATFTPTF